MPTVIGLVTVGPGSTAPPTPSDAGPANTGYEPTGVVLVPYPTTGGPAGPIVGGKLTISIANITLDGYDYACRVAVNAPNVTLTRSRFRGVTGFTDTGPASYGVLDCTSAACTNLTVEDCTIAPDQPAYRWTGLFGHNVTARRCNIYWGVDGGGGFNTHSAAAVNNVYENCWIHALAFYSPDPNHANDQPVSDSHSDGYQGQGGSGHTFRYCTIECFVDTDLPSRDGTPTGDILRSSANKNTLGGYSKYYPRTAANAALQFTQPSTPVGSAVANVTIDSCLLSGGQATVNFGAGAYTGVVITNNRFVRKTYGYYILFPAAEVTAVITGNVYADTGAPITPTRF